MNANLSPSSFPSVDLASLRSNILAYCGEFPQIVKAHGGAAIGSVSLSLGKCFKWIGPTLDAHNMAQPLAGIVPPTVSQLGEELRLVGLELFHANGDRTQAEVQIDALKRQIELLEKIAALERELR